MFHFKLSILVITFLSIILTVKCNETEKKFLTCNVTNSTPENTGCPNISKCIENVTLNGVLQGSCVCAPNYTVNQNYSATDNSSQYCIENKSPPAIQTTIITPTVTTPKPPVTTTAKIATSSNIPIIKSTAAAATSTSSSTTTTSTIATTNKTETDVPDEKSDVKVTPAPEPHHVLGGILLPIFIVLAFIAGVFVVRKYDVIDRVHGYVRNRNQQTRYNGLMENDFDDDPLLI